MSAISRLVPSCKDRKDRTSPSISERKKDGKDDRNNPEPKKKPQQYTSLTALMGEILLQLDQAKLPHPRKMKTPERKKDTSKYYRYHRDHGHDTNHYWKLTNEIEKLI